MYETFAAITAGGPPTRHKLLPSEGHAAVATVAGLDSNFCFVDEHCGRQSLVVGREPNRLIYSTDKH